MDKNSIIGLSLIGLIIIGYTIYTQPSAEELQAARAKRDSVAAVLVKQHDAEIAASQKASSPVVTDTIQLSDSASAEMQKQKLGDFASAATGTEQVFHLENKNLKIDISSKGGRIRSAELKNYKSWEGKPVRLMSSDSSDFNLTLSAQNRIINTSELFFIAQNNDENKSTLRLRLPAGDQQYIEYEYNLPEDSYMLNYKIKVVGLQNTIAENASYINLDWKENIIPQEKSITNERAATTVYYRFDEDDVDNINYAKNEKKSLKTHTKWIAFKQQFFTSVLISDDMFDSPVVETFQDPVSSHYVKTLSASFSLPYERKPIQTYGMRFYIGPNHYQTLKKIDDLNLEKLIPLGWGIFGWVNRYFIIFLFNFLDGFHLNYGIIILLLTIAVRIILLPLTYGSFKSQAKMKVLQPELAELNAKFGDDAMKKQQETMSLYKKAGVNPLGGCIPGLLQLPILIAMFRFFPASIELRQEPFLWAHDLSTYDSILDLSFKIPFYGDHVSLFTLLMTVSTLIYTRMNMQMTAAANPQMKWMMYLMPVLFLGFFNNYSAGLSYYYFLSNIFGFGQQYLFKAFIDQDAIHRQIQENKKKPVKKSSFQARLEQMAKERGVKPPGKR